MTRLHRDEVWTPEEVAELLRLRKDTVYAYIRAAELPAIRLGRHYRVLQEDLDRFLLARSTKPEVRNTVFDRVLEIATRVQEVPESELVADIAEAVAAARQGVRD